LDSSKVSLLIVLCLKLFPLYIVVSLALLPQQRILKALSKPLTPPQKGFFSGWSITFLFGPRVRKNSPASLNSGNASQPSFLQRILPWFFSAGTTPNSPDKMAEEIPVSMSHHSSVDCSSGSSRSSLNVDGVNAERSTLIENTMEEHPCESSIASRTWTSVCSAFEEPSMAPPATISLHVDPSGEGEKVSIESHGRREITSPEALELITQDLAATKEGYQNNPKSYLLTFAQDAKRSSIHTLEYPFVRLSNNFSVKLKRAE